MEFDAIKELLEYLDKNISSDGLSYFEITEKSISYNSETFGSKVSILIGVPVILFLALLGRIPFTLIEKKIVGWITFIIVFVGLAILLLLVYFIIYFVKKRVYKSIVFDLESGDIIKQTVFFGRIIDSEIIENSRIKAVGNTTIATDYCPLRTVKGQPIYYIKAYGVTRKIIPNETTNLFYQYGIAFAVDGLDIPFTVNLGMFAENQLACEALAEFLSKTWHIPFTKCDENEELLLTNDDNGNLSLVNEEIEPISPEENENNTINYFFNTIIRVIAVLFILMFCGIILWVFIQSFMKDPEPMKHLNDFFNLLLNR